MASPVDLAPCPFCGGAAEFERRGTGRQSCIVVCGDCGARHESGDSGDRCGSSWNHRESSRPSASSSVDLAPLRAALDKLARIWPGPLGVRRFVDDTGNDAAAVIDVATGETIATCDNEDRDDHATPVEDAGAIVALRNAAPAIAALADECERLRARIAKAEEVVAAARTLGSYAWTDRLDDSRTSDDAKEDESKLSSAVWQYDNPPNLHPDGCHTTAASAFRDCSGDGHHECRTCTRFDEDERAKRIGEE